MTLLFLLLALQNAPAATEPVSLSVVEALPYAIYYPAVLEREATLLASSAGETVESLRHALQVPPLGPTRLYVVSLRDAPGLTIEGLGSPSQLMPDWAAGVAFPQGGMVIIRVDRIGPYGQRQLQSIFAHETVHLLMGSSIAASGAPQSVPRWFREGVSSNLAHEGEWLDFVYLWISPVASSRRPLLALEEAFQSSKTPMMRRAAYAGSYSLVRFAIEKHGDDFPARILAGLRSGLTFDTAWARSSGTSYVLDAAEWSTATRGSRRWMAIVTSSFTLWTIISILFLLAYLAKRRRARRLLERWEEEEGGGL